MAQKQLLGIAGALVVALMLVPAADAVGIEVEFDGGVGAGGGAGAGGADAQALADIDVKFHLDAVGFDVESSADLAKITTEYCSGNTWTIQFEAGTKQYTHDGDHLIVGVWVDSRAAAHEEGPSGAWGHFDNDVECPEEEPDDGYDETDGTDGEADGTHDGYANETDGNGNESADENDRIHHGVGEDGDGSISAAVCLDLGATTNGDGSVSLHIDGLSESAVLLRAAGDAASEEIATLEAGDELHTDIDTEAGVTYTYTLVVDGVVCGLVEVTAIPVFPSVLTGGLAIGGSLLGYLGICRFM